MIFTPTPTRPGLLLLLLLLLLPRLPAAAAAAAAALLPLLLLRLLLQLPLPLLPPLLVPPPLRYGHCATVTVTDNASGLATASEFLRPLLLVLSMSMQ